MEYFDSGSDFLENMGWFTYLNGRFEYANVKAGSEDNSTGYGYNTG